MTDTRKRPAAARLPGRAVRGRARTCGCPRWSSQVKERDVLANGRPGARRRPARPAGSSSTSGSPSTRPTRCAPTGSRASTPTPTSARCSPTPPRPRSSPRLAPIEGEPVIDKGCVDPFVGTPLLDRPRRRGHPRRGARWRGHQPRRRVRGPARLRRRPVRSPWSRTCARPSAPTSTTSRCRTCCRCSAPSPPPTSWSGACHEHARVRRRGRRRRRGRPVSAACSAAENGARVALLERSTEAETGGNTRYTEAFLRMALPRRDRRRSRGHPRRRLHGSPRPVDHAETRRAPPTGVRRCSGRTRSSTPTTSRRSRRRRRRPSPGWVGTACASSSCRRRS